MNFTKFVRTKVQADEPVVSFSDNRFQFSSVFVKLSELGKYTHVEYFICEEQRKIAFKLHADSKSRDCFTLGKKSNNYRSAAGDVISRFSWIAKVANSPELEDRKFVASKQQGMWVIQLSPSFEVAVPRDKAPASLPDESGIYRYINNQGEIVYIGKGNIKNRYSDGGRDKWIFEKIEYSLVNGDEEQYEWEAYWIEKYKERSEGYLPHYNKNSGRNRKP